MSRALNLTKGAYFLRPWYLTRRTRTVRRKYQLRKASTMQMRTLEILSQYLLISTKLSRG